MDERQLSFGTSGRLWSNNLVRYDRQTQSLWPQLSFTASVAETGPTWNVLGLATDGPLAGEQRTSHRHVDTFWHSWVAFQPDTTILR